MGWGVGAFFFSRYMFCSGSFFISFVFFISKPM